MNENLLNRIAEAIQARSLNGVLVIDCETNGVFINNALCDMWQIKEEDIINKPMKNIFNNKIKKISGEYNGPLIKTLHTLCEIHAEEVYMTIPGGNESKWFLVNTFLLRDENGRPEYAVGNYIIIDKFKVIESRLNVVNMNIIKAFCKAIGISDIYTMQHSENVAALMVGLTEHMELSASDVTMAYLAGIVHDIGKIGISEQILNKPSRLTEEEYEIIKRHPGKGADILVEVDDFHDLATIVRHHHERYDGRGYPSGLAGEKIPLVSRMLTLCDSYDAMTSRRCYCKPHTIEQALQEIKECAGKQFDPKISKVFIDFLKGCNLNLKDVI